MNLLDDQFCFVCGRSNPDGLHLRFEYPEAGQARAETTPPKTFQGWRGILHGGIVSTLLDEAMAHAVGGPERGGGGSGAVTAEMTVRFLKPARTEEPVVVSARVIADQGRLVEAAAELTRPSGELLASAKAKLIRPKRPLG